MPSVAMAAGSAVKASGLPSNASTVPVTAIEPRKIEYMSTKKVSSVRVAPRVPSPARRSAHRVRAAPPAPAVGSRRVAAAPPSVICVDSRKPRRADARWPTSHSSRM
jgi:hypothetical protein